MRPNYFGVVTECGKSNGNLGMIMRASYNLHASFTGQIDGRYERSGDTINTPQHIPHWKWKNVHDFTNALPIKTDVVAVEFTEDSYSLEEFYHPGRAIYVLGPENGSVSQEILDICTATVKIPTQFCLNQANAASIVLWDRYLQFQKFPQTKHWIVEGWAYAEYVSDSYGEGWRIKELGNENFVYNYEESPIGCGPYLRCFSEGIPHNFATYEEAQEAFLEIIL